ncbi:hypothetical protein RF11_01080 [Thelohanellus kitauei]|uniref:Uncharacterized protein n=1 Tax=Thelohanellus kitauei TaxID=669202 RepID=A0A0C2MX35_THEKT|nr:hypothetical protein RF11_01080 [Thelohanellus kitauei]
MIKSESKNQKTEYHEAHREVRTELFFMMSEVISRVSRYVLTYPFIKYYHQLQVPVEASARHSEFYIFHYFWLLSRNEGFTSLWTGFVSYLAVNESLSFVLSYLKITIDDQVHNAVLRFLISLLLQSFIIVLVSPFYSTMLIDMIGSTSGARMTSLGFLMISLQRIHGFTSFNHSQNWFVKAKYLSFIHIGFGLIIQYFSHQFFMATLNTCYSFYHYIFPQPQQTGIDAKFESDRVNFWFSSISQVLCLPFWVTLTKICVQGYEVVIDTLKFTPYTMITSCVSVPTFYR